MTVKMDGKNDYIDGRKDATSTKGWPSKFDRGWFTRNSMLLDFRTEYNKRGTWDEILESPLGQFGINKKINILL